jgi:hypothetical protein
MLGLCGSLLTGQQERVCLAGFANVFELLFCIAMQSVKVLSKQGFIFVGVKGMPF